MSGAKQKPIKHYFPEAVKDLAIKDHTYAKSVDRENCSEFFKKKERKFKMGSDAKPKVINLDVDRKKPPKTEKKVRRKKKAESPMQVTKEKKIPKKKGTESTYV